MLKLETEKSSCSQPRRTVLQLEVALHEKTQAKACLCSLVDQPNFLGVVLVHFALVRCKGLVPVIHTCTEVLGSLDL